MVVFRAFLLGLLALLAPSLSFSAPIYQNSDFSSDLTGWSALGDVVVVSGGAVLSDPSGGGTLLQSVNGGPGSYTLTFDLYNGLSPKGDPGFLQNVFADIGAGTVYFSSAELNSGNLAGNSFTNLFDADSSGITSLLQSSSLGNDWFRYVLSFQTAFSYITTVFELFDQDFVTNSLLKIDNVVLEKEADPIPEPASLLLLGAALPLLRRRRN